MTKSEVLASTLEKIDDISFETSTSYSAAGGRVLGWHWWES